MSRVGREESLLQALSDLKEELVAVYVANKLECGTAPGLARGSVSSVRTF